MQIAHFSMGKVTPRNSQNISCQKLYNLQIFLSSSTGNENSLECPKHNINIIQFPDEELEGKQRQEKEKENKDFYLIVYIAMIKKKKQGTFNASEKHLAGKKVKS